MYLEVSMFPQWRRDERQDFWPVAFWDLDPANIALV